MDRLIETFEGRFGDEQMKLYQCCCDFLPTEVHKLTAEHFEAVFEMYPADFTEDERREVVDRELGLFKVLVKQDSFYVIRKGMDGKDLPADNLQDVTVALVANGLRGDLPVIYRIYTLLLLIPVSTASNERAFSALKRLKTRLRNTLSNANLNCLMLIYINSDEIAKDIEVDDILRRWVKMGKDGGIVRRKIAWMKAGGLFDEAKKGRGQIWKEMNEKREQDRQRKKREREEEEGREEKEKGGGRREQRYIYK